MDCVKHVYASKDDVRKRCIVVVTVAGVLGNVDILERWVLKQAVQSRSSLAGHRFRGPHSMDQVQDVPFDIL